MREKFLLTVLCVFISCGLIAQTDSVTGLLGIIDNQGFEHYEWAGYAITKGKIKTPKSEKDIQELKKTYNIKNITREYSASKINRPNRIIESISESKPPKTVSLHYLFYILEANNKESDLIIFSKYGERDNDIEQQFINLYLENKLSGYISSQDMDSINFAGRTIHLGDACQWEAPHIINCGYGRIAWSEFNSYEKAKNDLSNIIKSRSTEKLVILEDTTLPVLFEGNSTEARRIVYKYIEYPDYYPLIEYYVLSEIRGRYVHSIMSHYGYNRNDYELPDLLKEVMQFEETPESAWNKYDIPEKDELNTEQKQIIENIRTENKFKSYIFNIKSGIYIPLGRQAQLIGGSPYIDLEVNFDPSSKNVSINENSNSVLFVNMGVVMPNNRQPFNYYGKELMLPAKVYTLYNANFGYKHKKKIKRYVYWENHIKLGMSGLTTNQKIKDKKDGNHRLSVFNAGIGTNIRFKRGGIFFEYQFAPFSKSKHLDKGGNSAIITGLSIAF